MKARLIVLLILLVVSVTFVGCGATCPVCKGASSPGSPIKCERCNNTGSVDGPYLTDTTE